MSDIQVRLQIGWQYLLLQEYWNGNDDSKDLASLYSYPFDENRTNALLSALSVIAYMVQVIHCAFRCFTSLPLLWKNWFVVKRLLPGKCFPTLLFSDLLFQDFLPDNGMISSIQVRQLDDWSNRLALTLSVGQEYMYGFRIACKSKYRDY